MLIIILPWPPACISPNAKRRTHWSAYRQTTKAYRTECHYLTRQAMGRTVYGAVKAVTISFAPPDARLRDDDNTVGAFKAGRDGIAAALGHDDNTWRGKVRYEHLEPARPLGWVTVKLEFEDGAVEP